MSEKDFSQGDVVWYFNGASWPKKCIVAEKLLGVDNFYLVKSKRFERKTSSFYLFRSIDEVKEEVWEHVDHLNAWLWEKKS